MLLRVPRLHEEDLEEALLREDRTEIEEVPAIFVGAAPADRSGLPWRDADLFHRRAARSIGDAPDHREGARVRGEILRELRAVALVEGREAGDSRRIGARGGSGGRRGLTLGAAR